MSFMEDLEYISLGWRRSEAYQRLRAFIEQHEPWLPPRQPGFGPWLEYKPGDKGPHVNDRVMVLDRVEREKRDFVPAILNAQTVDWEQDGNGWDPVAYCVKEDEA